MQPELIADRYRVERAVGRGGMGIVWLCTDEILHRRVAVKQVGSLPGESPDETVRAMREARLGAALNHKNAVSIYDVVADGATTWLVMEYVPSHTLSQLIAAVGRLPPSRVAHIGAQVAAALSSAHALGIVHRDIKPGNILVGEDDVALISDFGIARGHQDVKLTQTGMVTGTPAFFSPELARGEEATFASDVWAFGITLYTATEGAPPYEPHSNPLAMLNHIASEPLPPPTHAGVMTGVIEDMLRFDPQRRSTMPDVVAALTRVTQQVGAAQDPHAGVDDGFGAAAVLEPSEQTSLIEPAVEPEYEQPVMLPAVASSWTDQPWAQPTPPTRRHHPVGRLATAALGLLVLVGAAALLWNLLGLGSTGSQSPTSLGASGATGTKSGRSHHHKGTGAPHTGSTTSGAPTTTPTTTASSGETSTQTSATTTSTPSTPLTTGTSHGPTKGSNGSGSATTPEDFARSYFDTVPGDLDAGWNLIAPSMQARLGRGSYDGFWGSVASVDVSNVFAVDSQTVQYQIVYTLTDGSQSSETKQLTLQRSGDSYAITSDTNVS